MGINVFSSQGAGKRGLLSSMSSGDASAIAAIISASPGLLTLKVDSATGNNPIHAAVLLNNNAAQSLATLMSAVSAG